MSKGKTVADTAPPTPSAVKAPEVQQTPAALTEHVTSDWITIGMACRIFPSRQPGKRINKRTVWRWILKGKIEHTRNAMGWVFVRKSQIEALLVPAEVKKAEQKERTRAQRQWDAHGEAILAKYGI